MVEEIIKKVTKPRAKKQKLAAIEKAIEDVIPSATPKQTAELAELINVAEEVKVAEVVQMLGYPKNYKVVKTKKYPSKLLE